MTPFENENFCAFSIALSFRRLAELNGTALLPVTQVLKPWGVLLSYFYYVQICIKVNYLLEYQLGKFDFLAPHYLTKIWEFVVCIICSTVKVMFKYSLCLKYFHGIGTYLNIFSFSSSVLRISISFSWLKLSFDLRESDLFKIIFMI